MNLFELAAKLTLDSSEYESGLNNASNLAKSAGGKIGGAMKTIGKIGAAAMGAAGAAVLAFAKSSVTAAADFEGSFAQLSTIMDTTAMNAEKMQAGLMEMSSRMGISASELAETTYNAISATGDTVGSLAIVENATKLATAGFTDTSSALSVLTTAMNSYKMSAEETETISNSLIAVQNLGVTTVSELASSMGKAIASASAYSVDLYNLESAYVSLTKSGINTAESTTYISSMMKELGSDSTKVAKIVKSKTGKSFADLMKDGKSLGDVLKVLNEAVDGDANALMNLWSSAEAGKASNAILSQGLEQFNDNLDSIRNSTGLTQEAYDKMTDTLQFKTGKLKTNFENLKISFGSNLIPGIGDIVDTITDGLGEITTAVQSGDWDAAFAAIGETLSGVVGDVSAKIPALTRLSVLLIQSLFDGLSDNADILISGVFDVITSAVNALPAILPDLISGATDLLIAVIDALDQNSGALIDSVITVVETLINSIEENDVLGKLVDVLIDLAKLALEGLADMMPTVLPQIANLIAQLLVMLTDPEIMMELTDAAMVFLEAFAFALLDSVDVLNASLPKLVMNIASRFVDSFKAEFKALNLAKTIIVEMFSRKIEDAKQIGSWLKENVWEPIKQWFADAGEWVKTELLDPLFEKMFGTDVEGVKENISAFFQSIKDTIEPIITSISDLFSAFGDLAAAAWAFVKETVGGAIAEVKGKFDEIWLKVSTVATDVWNTVSEKFGALYDAVSQPLQEFYDKVTGVFNDAKDWITGIVAEAWNWGHDLISNIIDGIGSLIDSLTTKVKGVATTIWNYLHQSTAEVGPLKDTDRWGVDLMDNIINGIQRKRGELDRVISGLSDDMDFRSAMTVTPDISANKVNPTETRIDAISAKLDALTDAILHQHWELDGDVVATRVDERLGSTTTMKARV